MNFGNDAPTFEELMEVVQRQQEVIEIFEQQIEACRYESLKLTEESLKKSEIIKILEDSEILMKTEIEQLKNENEQLMEGNKRKEDQNEMDIELETIGEFRMKCKELNYELETLKTRNSALIVELETEKRNHEFTRTEITEERRQRGEEKKKMIVTMEMIEKQTNEKRREQQEVQSKQHIELAKLKTQMEIYEQREKQMERHYQDIMEEITEIRREKAKAAGRNTGLAAENAELRSRIQQLRTRLPRNEHEIEDMQKLLGDQSHLISALREETKLLARKLEGDSREYRLLRFLSGTQILLIISTYFVIEQSHTESVRNTVNLVLLVHLAVSIALALMSVRQTAVTPNSIGLSLYTLAGSLSLGFISSDEEDSVLFNFSMALITCGFLSFGTCWWTVYQEKFQNLW